MRSRNLESFVAGLLVVLLIIGVSSLAMGGDYLLHRASCGAATYWNGNGFQCPIRILIQPH